MSIFFAIKFGNMMRSFQGAEEGERPRCHPFIGAWFGVGIEGVVFARKKRPSNSIKRN